MKKLLLIVLCTLSFISTVSAQDTLTFKTVVTSLAFNVPDPVCAFDHPVANGDTLKVVWIIDNTNTSGDILINVNPKDEKVDIRLLSSGIYFAVVEGLEGTKVSQFIVE
jgi:hypothetical protein